MISAKPCLLDESKGLLTWLCIRIARLRPAAESVSGTNIVKPSLGGFPGQPGRLGDGARKRLP